MAAALRLRFVDVGDARGVVLETESRILASGACIDLLWLYGWVIVGATAYDV